MMQLILPSRLFSYYDVPGTALDNTPCASENTKFRLGSGSFKIFPRKKQERTNGKSQETLDKLVSSFLTIFFSLKVIGCICNLRVHYSAQAALRVLGFCFIVLGQMSVNFRHELSDETRRKSCMLKSYAQILIIVKLFRLS